MLPAGDLEKLDKRLAFTRHVLAEDDDIGRSSSELSSDSIDAPCPTPTDIPGNDTERRHPLELQLAVWNIDPRGLSDERRKNPK